jgi:hypothetical protein
MGQDKIAPFVKMTQAPLSLDRHRRMFDGVVFLADDLASQFCVPLTTSFLKRRCDTGVIDWRLFTYDSKDALYDYGNCEVV